MTVLAGCGASATEQAEIDAVERGRQLIEDRIRTHVEIGPRGAIGALNRFILIRKATYGCAIRFTSYRRDHDQRPPTFFNTGNENMYGAYDWYFQGDGSFDFTRSNVQAGQGKLHLGPVIQFGIGATV